jgi:hypothetical protein
MATITDYVILATDHGYELRDYGARLLDGATVAGGYRYYTVAGGYRYYVVSTVTGDIHSRHQDEATARRVLADAHNDPARWAAYQARLAAYRAEEEASRSQSRFVAATHVITTLDGMRTYLAALERRCQFLTRLPAADRDLREILDMFDRTNAVEGALEDWEAAEARGEVYRGGE